jgi:predicted metal-dependent HD superfamily phosphohydrolase
VTTQAEVLADRWESSFPGRVALGHELVRRYSSVTRVYHDIRHLADVLAGVDLLSDEAADPRAVELAGWFHDAVYDVRRSDNEERSAVLAESVLPAYDFDDPFVAETARLVRLTQDHEAAPGDTNGAVLCDADLAVLARPESEYDDYTSLVRAEYRHVDEESFRSGRARILQGLLRQPTLFRTGYGRAHWEQPARANMERELSRLSV